MKEVTRFEDNNGNLWETKEECELADCKIVIDRAIDNCTTDAEVIIKTSFLDEIRYNKSFVQAINAIHNNYQEKEKLMNEIHTPDLHH